MNKSELRSQIKVPERPCDANKKDFGHVLVIAGSVGMTGAACLASDAALRSGAGLVTLGIPASLNEICEVKLTEVMTKPLAETANRSLSENAFSQICPMASGSDAVLVGPGLSTDESTKNLVKALLQTVNKPLVLDADALNALSESPEGLKKANADELIITPHPGEMARLLDMSSQEVQKNRENIARTFASVYGVYVVLKGAGTVVASPDGEVYVNETGNSGMATAGSGDVLSGLLTGFLAQGMGSYDAARCAVCVHGMAGDEAAKDVGERSLTASDILLKIPLAIKSFFG